MVKFEKNKFWLVFIALLSILLVGGYVQSMRSSSNVSPAPIVSTGPHESSASVSLTTTYEGQLPCADCPGIDEKIVLTRETPEATGGAYVQTDTYLEKGPPIETKGTWVIADSILELTSDIGDVGYFAYSEDKLEMLDRDKKKIDSPFNQILLKK